MHQPGERKAKCGGCQLVFPYQIAFVSPELIDKRWNPKRVADTPAPPPTLELDSDDAGTNWESAIEDCDSILSQCDEIPERGEEFADSIREKVGSIRDWIEENKTVTPAQLQALENMADGVGRWIDR
jgi:hypothetical protein